MAVSPSISIHSNFAGPSGPAELHVISQTPGAPLYAPSARTSPQTAIDGLAVEISDESLGAVEGARAPSGDVLLGLTLHRLPALGPEPRLIGAMREDRMQLDHPIGATDHFDLGAWLVEV